MHKLYKILLESERNMKSESLKTFVENFGQKYSEILGIDLSSGKNEEIFKWFLASVLFGAPITEKAVIKTYKCFEKYNVLTPKRIFETGWDGLVKILDEGSYTRYDFKTADKLLEVMRNLIERYCGSLTVLYNEASDGQDLERRLKDLGKGIGDVTVSIFLRELREVWEKANPKPTSLVILAAEKLGIVKKEATEDALKQLKDFWSKNKVAGKSFVYLETALLRLGKDFCRKEKCADCPVKDGCLDRVAL
jgi:endonuclease III